MIAGLGRFAEALRREGVAVSPAELLDAARAVQVVGIENRTRFRLALRATLGKGPRQLRVFDREFERFFTAPARVRRRGRADSATGQAGGEGAGGAGEAPRVGPRRHERESPSSRVRGHRSKGDTPEGQAERVRRALAGALEGRRAQSGRLRRAQLEADRRGGSARAAPTRTVDPLAADLAGRMTTDEERELSREIPRLIQRIRLRASRRRRRSSRGRVWLRQAHRANVGRGGVPFVLPRQRRRRRDSRVVLLIDVSYSVARAAGYFLWIATAFLQRSRRVRIVFFVDRPVAATAIVRRWHRERAPELRENAPARSRPGRGIRPFARSFAQLLDSVEGLNLDAPSDYGRALHQLLTSELRPAGKDTILLVLGDARTNRFDPLPWALEELSDRTRGIVWLLPEPRSRWGTGDSALGSYLPFVDTVVEAHNLRGLERGVVELLRRLG